MSTFLDALLTEQGCQVDGTMGLNPIGQLLDYVSGGLADNAIISDDFGFASEVFYLTNLLNDYLNAIRALLGFFIIFSV